MTVKNAINTLKEYNKWRRGKNTPQPHPTDIGEAIDIVLAALEQSNETIPKSNINSQ